MRGYAGAGKSTWAKKKAEATGAIICSSDSFFMKNGKYVFDFKKLATNHFKCYNKFVETLCVRKDVIVDNTNIKLSDIKLYLDMIKTVNEECGETYKVRIVTVLHNSVETAIALRKDQADDKNVPEETIRNMYENLVNTGCDSLVKEYPKIVFEFETVE